MESNPHIVQEIRRLEEQYAFRPDSLVFGRLADLHRKAGNPGRALDILEEGLRRHPRYLSAHIVRARCLRALGHGEEARQAFREVLELDAQNLVALRSLAETALERGEREEALRHLEALLQVDPRDDEARRMLAQTEEAMERAEAEDGGERAEAEEAGDAAPAGATGREAEELREQVAELDLDEPAGADDDGEVATRTLAGLYETQGFYREAVEMYERLLQERPESEAEEIRRRLERARAALSETGGRGSTSAAEENPVPTSGDGVVEEAPGGEPDADGRGPSAGEHLRALLCGEAGIPVRPEGGAARDGRGAAGGRSHERPGAFR